MKKRILALFALIIPLTLMLCGCGRLSVKEYYEELNAGFEEYASALIEFENVNIDVKSSQEIMLEQTKATEICDRAEKALDRFAKMNPPEEFSEKHEELLVSVELERKFVNATRKVLTATTPDEMLIYSSEADAVLNGVPADKQFPAVIKRLLEEVTL